MTRLIAAAVALAAFCGSAVAGISFEEEIPAFRRDVDSWNLGRGLRGKWIGSGLAVSVQGRSGFTMKYDRYPGMKPFRGAMKTMLATIACLPARMEGGVPLPRNSTHADRQPGTDRAAD